MADILVDDDAVASWEFSVDMNEAYNQAVMRMKARIDNSLIPGSMLEQQDAQNIVNELLTAMTEFAILNQALVHNEGTDIREAVREQIHDFADTMISGFDIIQATIRSVGFHNEPAKTN